MKRNDQVLMYKYHKKIYQVVQLLHSKTVRENIDEEIWKDDEDIHE